MIPSNLIVLLTGLTCAQIWNKVIRDGKFVLEHIKSMNHLDPAGFNFQAAITCILPMAKVVYTGDEDGRVVSKQASFFGIARLLSFNRSTSGIAFSARSDDN